MKKNKKKKKKHFDHEQWHDKIWKYHDSES